uniref:Uncharacterized protein n=1 Tax=Arundo donax TaxID=35708 RepID=A0A0A9E7B8_ARUDO
MLVRSSATGNSHTSTVLSFDSLIVSADRWLVKADSARNPAIPLCPFADAKSAGLLPEGNSEVGSDNAPAAAPFAIRTPTVRSLPKDAAQ